MKRVLFIFFLFSPLIALAQQWKPVYAPFDSLMLVSEEDMLLVPEVPPGFEENVEKMQKMASARGDRRLQWRSLYWMARLDSRYDRCDDAIKKLNRAISMVDSNTYEYDYRRMQFLKQTRLESSNMVNVYRASQRHLKYFHKINDPVMEAECYASLARAFNNLGIWDKGLQYLEKAIDILHKLGKEERVAVLEGNYFYYYALKGDTARARTIYRNLLKNAQLKRDVSMLIIIYTNAAVSDVDIKAVKKAHELALEYGESSRINYTGVNLGYYYLNYEKDPAKALQLFKYSELHPIASNGVNHDSFKMAELSGFSECYAQLGKPDSALLYLNRYVEFKDSLDVLNSNANFQEMYEKLSLEREEEHVAQEQSKARNRLVFIVLVFSLLLIMALAVLYYFYNRRKLKETENERLATEVEKEQLERILYQQQCEDRERELTTNSLLLIEKRKMIENLNQQIEECGAEGKIDREAKRKLLGFIKIHENTEESLQQFYDYFNRVHPDFFLSLKQLYPELTNGDLRLCAYIRIGLDSKQIAQITAVQPHTIKQARYRLRKKLGLSTQDSLEDFLMLRPDRVPAP